MKFKTYKYLFTLILLIIGNCEKENEKITVIDIDGNVYNTVRIGSQLWMVENLKTTHYRNGDLIPNVINDTLWGKKTTGAYCNYSNDVEYSIIYGRLYNWYAVNDNRNICPEGWHVPTDAEWTLLENYLGGNIIAGGKMKETGIAHWVSPNTGATNESGFTALPGAGRYRDGTFTEIGYFGNWWSSSIDNKMPYAIYRNLTYYDAGIYWGGSNMADGFSIRCLRDSM